MDALRRNEDGSEAAPDSPNGIREAYARILRTCLFAGLPTADAEDVAQDLFLWLLRSGPLETMPVTPWLATAVQHFIRRQTVLVGLIRTQLSRGRLRDHASAPMGSAEVASEAGSIMR